jgi:hypothetical protein
MTDKELRGLVLQWFYDHRREDLIELNPDALSPAVDQRDIFAICEQLDENGLIKWNGLKRLGGWVAGAGKITAAGVDAIEEKSSPPAFPMVFPTITQNISVANSQGVQIGNNNTLTFVEAIDQMIHTIENSNFTMDQKEEAKSRLKAFLSHPLVTAVLGSAVNALLAKLTGPA